MTLPFNMMNKNGIVTARLTRELMILSEGDRIDTVSSYAKKFDSARGTIQNVIKLLENEKVVELKKRGHLGTFITFIDYKKLWKFTYLGVLTGAAPLPYTKKHEGLATAIYYEMEQREIPFNFAYMQGAENRARGLLNERYDFIISSKASAMELISKYPDLSIAMELKPYSYLNGYVLVYLDEKYDEIIDGMNLGIDKNSPDHVAITKHLCENKKVNYINSQYTRMIPNLIKGKIDAAVYNKDTIEKPEINAIVSHKEINLKNCNEDENTKAVILINNKTFGISNLLKQVLNIDEIEKIQNDVIFEIIPPTY